MSRVKTSSILQLETSCEKIVSDIREIIKEMGEYKIDDESSSQERVDNPNSFYQIARNAFANEKWDLALCHVASMRRCTNDNAHLLVAMVYSRPDIREARYDIAILHLEEILRKKPEEKRVEKFRDLVQQALKLQQKLEETERCIDIEEEKKSQTHHCFCF